MNRLTKWRAIEQNEQTDKMARRDLRHVELFILQKIGWRMNAPSMATPWDHLYMTGLSTNVLCKGKVPEFARIVRMLYYCDNRNTFFYVMRDWCAVLAAAAYVLSMRNCSPFTELLSECEELLGDADANRKTLLCFLDLLWEQVEQ